MQPQTYISNILSPLRKRESTVRCNNRPIIVIVIVCCKLRQLEATVSCNPIKMEATINCNLRQIEATVSCNLRQMEATFYLPLDIWKQQLVVILYR